LAVACGAAEPTAVAGGKDYLRSAASLVGQPQQSPTANSETFTSPPVVGWQEAEVNVVNQKNLADHNFAPFRSRTLWRPYNCTVPIASILSSLARRRMATAATDRAAWGITECVNVLRHRPQQPRRALSRGDLDARNDRMSTATSTVGHHELRGKLRRLPAHTLLVEPAHAPQGRADGQAD
jgi:hypothetical protein